MRQAIEGAGCRLLYLPPYSPDLNPIEQAFAKLKALLRKAGERTVEGLWRLLGRLLDEFAPTECRNYFRHAATPLHLRDQPLMSHFRLSHKPRPRMRIIISIVM